MDAHVPAAAVTRSPTLLVVALEDIHSRIAMASKSRRPHRWHRRAYTAWAAQDHRQEDKHERLHDLVNLVPERAARTSRSDSCYRADQGTSMS